MRKILFFCFSYQAFCVFEVLVVLRWKTEKKEAELVANCFIFCCFMPAYAA